MDENHQAVYLKKQCSKGTSDLKTTVFCNELVSITQTKSWEIPSGNWTWLWKVTFFGGGINYKWPFSIAMFVYQRVYLAGKSGCPTCSHVLIRPSEQNFPMFDSMILLQVFPQPSSVPNFQDYCTCFPVLISCPILRIKFDPYCLAHLIPWSSNFFY